jgi:antirestriction protein ArdC
MLDNGTIPWQQPYLEGEQGAMPRNLISNREYSGINRWLLWQKFPSPYYLTFNQAKELGGNVRKGEKASMITFCSKVESIDKATNEKTTRAILRYYNVFNVTQCENLEHVRLEEKDNGNREMVKPNLIVKNMPNKPAIKPSNKPYAYYYPAKDEVCINGVKQFKTSEAYYSTLFHELAHSTGHESRLARELGTTMEKEKYSREELVAEFASAFLCEVAGISKPTIKNAASYISHWKQFLASDAKAVVTCASRAEKAASYILGKLDDDDK